MYVKGDIVEIIDESVLPIEYSRLLKHYQKGQQAIVVENFYGYISIQTESKVSSILLSPDELSAIRKKEGERDDSL